MHLASTLFGYVYSAGATVASLCVAVALFAGRLQPRERFGRRVVEVVLVAVALGAAVLAMFTFAGGLASGTGDPAAAFAYPVQLVLFSALLGVLTLAVCWLFDASVWTALFCCTAGYVVQNLASGLAEASWLVTGFSDYAALDMRMRLARALLSLACFTVVCLAFYLLSARHINREALEQIDDRRMLVVMAVVMLGVIGFDLVIKSLTADGLATGYALLLRASHGLTCVLTYWLDYELLVARRLEVERATTEHVLVEREHQYQQGRANIEAINIKCHDIRHQIRQLAADAPATVDPEFLADVEHEIDVYDTHVETGNQALDTVLSEKGVACNAAGIGFSCVADGAGLGFMAPADIYSFFGNALDNAIRAVGELPAERRGISVVVREAMGTISIHIENPCADDVRFEGGLPLTTQEGEGHGFGVRSMRNTVERYGGTLSLRVSDGVFHVNALIPIPEAAMGSAAPEAACVAESR